MLAIIFVIGSVALGYQLLSISGLDFIWQRRLALGAVFGLLLTTCFSFALASVLQSSDWATYITEALCFFALGWASYEKVRTHPVYKWRDLLVLFFLGGTSVYAFFEHAPHPDAVGSLVNRGYTWADGPLHMTIASHFLALKTPALNFSLLPNTNLTYPFLFDWQTSVLLRLGGGWMVSYGLPAAVLALAGLYLSWDIVRSMARSARAGYLHLILFLGIGSAGGGIILLQDFLAGDFTWTKDYSNLTLQGLDLANPLTSHFFPQRTFLFGFALVCACLVVGQRIITLKKWSLLWVLALIIGLMPLVHVHSFVIISIASLVAATVLFIKYHEIRLWLALSALVFLALVLPQVAWLHTVPSAATAHLGWMWDGKGSLALYWLNQLGVTLALMAIGTVLLVKKQCSWQLVSLVTGGWIIFLVCNLFQFHASAFDNLKFMLYSFWAMLIPATLWLDSLWNKTWAWLVVVLVALCSFTGIMTIIREFKSDVLFADFTASDVAAAADIKTIIPNNDRIVIVPRHNSMITALAGREVLVGYTGWLWSYGLSYTDYDTAEQAILNGDDDGTLIKKYNIHYIAVSEDDFLESKASYGALTLRYPKVYAANNWTIFDATQPFTTEEPVQAQE